MTAGITQIDTTIGRTTNDGPSITRIYHVGQHTVRIRVARDFYLTQSHALAEVLTPALTWTALCEQPPQGFFDKTALNGPKAATTEALLLNLADELANRAARILRASTE
jgi:hypothetical protein